MRVIAGLARGMQLTAPGGRGTRPIADRVKETLFAILGERVIDARVLDLYAGSGAIGIEALSRGALHCTFVERGRSAAAAIRANVERTGLDDRSEVVQVEVDRFLAAVQVGAFDLAILDPPYDERAILAPLQRLVTILPTGSTVVVKHFWRTPPPAVAGLATWRERRFGETALTFLERIASDGGGKSQ